MNGTEAQALHCSDIVSCLRQDTDRVRALLGRVEGGAAPGREAFRELLPLLASRTGAAEEVVTARALELDGLRPLAMEGIEEHDLIEIMAEKVRISANEEQWRARSRVFAHLLTRSLEREERELFPLLARELSGEEREELGHRYLEARTRNELAPVFQMPLRESLLQAKSGASA